MGLFGKKSIAKIYVNELRGRLDERVVPVFPPDTDVDVGDFGFFEDGRFIVKGNVGDRGIELGEIVSDAVNAFDFASEGKVKVGPTVTVPNPLGGDLAKATIEFTEDRAVVAAFAAGVEESVRDADAFGDTLVRLWRDQGLRGDRAVVWKLRRVEAGTVMVARDGGTKVDVLVDSALAGVAGIALPSLALGVDFAAESSSTWKLSSSERPLIAWAHLLKLKGDQAADAFGFERGVDPATAAARFAPFTVDDYLTELERDTATA